MWYNFLSMKKTLKIFFVVILLIFLAVLIRWASCVYSCNRENPKSECAEGTIGCPYAGCAYNCYLFCVNTDSGPLCLFPAPSWMIGL